MTEPLDLNRYKGHTPTELWGVENQTIYALREVPGKYRNGVPVSANVFSAMFDREQGVRLGIATEAEQTANFNVLADSPLILAELKAARKLIAAQTEVYDNQTIAAIVLPQSLR